MRISKIIERARRMQRIKDGAVLCDNCDNPASKSLSEALSWTCCGPCATGESDSLDDKDYIYAGQPEKAAAFAGGGNDE